MVRRFIALSAFLPLLLGCGAGLRTDLPGGGSSLNLSLEVTPVYPSNGANWNDYILNADASASKYAQNDSACTGGSIAKLDACYHGGELKKVTVSALTSCTGLTLSDSLGVFDWTCQTSSGSVVFYSSLKNGKGLRDLVSATAWRTNRVTLSLSGNAVGSSSSSVWWQNTVAALPDNSGTSVTELNANGTVYVLAASRASHGYNLNAEKISIVTLPGATLTLPGAAVNNCNTADGTTGAPNIIALVCSGSKNYLWLEGNFNGSNAAYGLFGYEVWHSTVRNFVVSQAISGMYIYLSTNNRIEDFNISNTSSVGMYIRWISTFNRIQRGSIENISSIGLYLYNSASDNVVDSVNIAHCTDRGIYTRAGTSRVAFKSVRSNDNLRGFYLRGCTGCKIIDSVASNNTEMGIWLYETTSNTSVVRTLVANNGTYGIYDGSSSRTTINQLTAVNNANQGIYLVGDDNVVANSISINNASGLQLDGDNNLVHNLVALNNQDFGVSLSTSNSNAFTGSLKVGSNGTDCDEDGGTVDQGVTDACGSTHVASNFTLTSGLDGSAAFVGKLTTDDPSSDDDVNGVFPYDQTLDWFTFANVFRIIGKDGNLFADSTNRGLCSAGNCRIWDFRLVSVDTIARAENGVFSSDAACPTTVDGDVSLTDGHSSANTFLLNAMETYGDGIGDDDGLCESNEACVFSPNLGFYQNQDESIAGSCTFNDGVGAGAITDVSLSGV